MTTQRAFSDYAIIPLDVSPPAVDMHDLRDFLQKHCERCAFTNNVIRYVLFLARKPVVNGQLLLHAADQRLTDEMSSERFDWDPAFKLRFPGLVDWFEQFPFDELYGIDLVTQTDDIQEHMDIFGHNNSETYFARYREIEPMYYRTVFRLDGDEVARTRSLYVTREFHGEKFYVELPREVYAFAMSSSVCYHGACFNRGHYKTTAATYGSLNRARHLDLLERSLAKFGTHAIKFEACPVPGPARELPYGGG
jgi:hypothetical protein